MSSLMLSIVSSCALKEIFIYNSFCDKCSLGRPWELGVYPCSLLPLNLPFSLFSLLLASPPIFVLLALTLTSWHPFDLISSFWPLHFPFWHLSTPFHPLNTPFGFSTSLYSLGDPFWLLNYLINLSVYLWLLFVQSSFHSYRILFVGTLVVVSVKP